MIRTRRKLLRELVAGATIATMPACATESPATPHAGGSRSAKRKAGAQQAEGYQPGNVQPMGLYPESGFRSGLPWRSGVASWKPEEFAEWRGRPLDVLTTFSSFNTWDEIEKLGRDGTMLGALLDRPEQIVVSFAMFPRKDGPVPRDEPDAVEGCRRTAATTSIGSGPCAICASAATVTTISSGPAGNGTAPRAIPGALSTWTGPKPTKPRSAGWSGSSKRHFPMPRSTGARSRKGSRRSESTCSTLATTSSITSVRTATTASPRPPRPEAFARTQDETDRDGGPVGIRAWLRYAQSKGKPMSIPEWGVWSENGRKGGGAGDNPVFIEQMFAFFSANAKSIGYECYFNNMGGDAQHRIGPGDVPNPLGQRGVRSALPAGMTRAAARATGVGEAIAVIGLGYVGLPVAVGMARAHGAVVGFDIDRGRVRGLARRASTLPGSSARRAGRPRSALQRRCRRTLPAAPASSSPCRRRSMPTGSRT